MHRCLHSFPTRRSSDLNAGTPQSTVVSTAFGTALQALVKDGSSNPVSGVTVTFTAPGSGASGTFPGASLTATATTNPSGIDRKSTRLNSSHLGISYAVF